MLADSRNVQITRFSSLFLLTSLYYDEKCLILTTLGTSLIMGTTGTLILVDLEANVYVSSVAFYKYSNAIPLQAMMALHIFLFNICQLRWLIWGDNGLAFRGSLIVSS